VSHLGDRVAALVDGQLAPDAFERAHSHLAGCRACRELVELERLTKSRLASMSAPEPGFELMARLSLMAGPDGPLPPREGRVPGTPRIRPVAMPPAPGRQPIASVRPVGNRPPGRLPLRRAAARPRVRMAAAAAMVGALSLLGAGVAGSASPGSPSSPASPRPQVQLPLDQFSIEPTSSELPAAGWSSLPQAGR
jgi:hypothetical protein